MKKVVVQNIKTKLSEFSRQNQKAFWEMLPVLEKIKIYEIKFVRLMHSLSKEKRLEILELMEKIKPELLKSPGSRWRMKKAAMYAAAIEQCQVINRFHLEGIHLMDEEVCTYEDPTAYLLTLKEKERDIRKLYKLDEEKLVILDRYLQELMRISGFDYYVLSVLEFFLLNVNDVIAQKIVSAREAFGEHSEDACYEALKSIMKAFEVCRSRGEQGIEQQ